MIPSRPLPGSALLVSALGYGVSGPLGSAACGAREVKRLVDAAWGGGINLFDTAPFYGAAEARLGAALRGRDTSGLVLCTKAGKRRSGGAFVPAFSPAEVRTSLEASRRTLGRVDILLLHGPAPEHLTPSLTDTLETLKHEGAIRAWGVCARDWPEDAPPPPVIQAPAFEPLATRAAARGAGVMGIEVLRDATPDLRMPTRISDLWYLARGLRRGAVAASSATPEALLRRALTTPHLASALVTTTRTAHLEANIAVARTLRA